MSQGRDLELPPEPRASHRGVPESQGLCTAHWCIPGGHVNDLTHQLKPKRLHSNPNLGLWDQQANLSGDTKNHPWERPSSQFSSTHPPSPRDCLTLTLLLEQCEGRGDEGTKCPLPQKHLAWAPTGPQAKLCQYFWLYRAKRQFLHRAKRETVIMNTGHRSLPTSPFYRRGHTRPFSTNRRKTRGHWLAPAPGSSQSEAEESSRQPGDSGPPRAGSADGCCTDTYGKGHTQENVCTYGCSSPAQRKQE